jgi:multisubunit Na+/H+ antiporter MnhB subunit
MISPDNLFSKPASFLRNNLLKIELVALPLSALGYFLFWLRFEPGEFILSGCLTGLGTIYYLTAFRPIPNKNKFEEFCIKLTSWTISVITIGVLFSLLHWVGGRVVVRIGLISIVIVLFLAIINVTLLKKENAFEKQDIFRLLVAFAIVVLFSFSTFNKPNSGEREKEEMEEQHQQTTPETLP